MATPDGHLTVVLDLATFANEGWSGIAYAALQACQRIVARVLALCLVTGTRPQWLFCFVDSHVPPHAFTLMADLMKASSAGRTELHIKMRCELGAAATGASRLTRSLCSALARKVSRLLLVALLLSLRLCMGKAGHVSQALTQLAVHERSC